ncbi:MAG: hypothetical protein ACR2ME_04140 [Acidimicrobiia bacterium]
MAPNDISDQLEPSDQQWFYCLHHQSVEPVDGCRSEVRLGPYPTRDEAARALETAEKRNQAWEEDPAWNDDE